jgi:tetratricopeptide (TPR) repeat protein
MKQRWSISLFFLWACLSLFSVEASSRLQHLLSQGDMAFGNRNQRAELERALSQYEKAHTQFPESIEAAWKTSMALHSLATRYTHDEAKQRELFEVGLEIARQAADKDPSCGECQFWTAIQMAQYGEVVGVFKMISSLSEIKERLERAATLTPEHAMGGPYRVLGTIYQTLPGILGGDNEKALLYFQKAVTTSPTEAVNYLSLAKLKATEGEPAAAQEIARAGLRAKDTATQPISVESEESIPELSALSTSQ